MADHVLMHFELERVNVLFLMILKKQNFMNLVQDGRNTPRKWDNSAKSGKVDLSGISAQNHVSRSPVINHATSSSDSSISIH